MPHQDSKQTCVWSVFSRQDSSINQENICQNSQQLKQLAAELMSCQTLNVDVKVSCLTVFNPNVGYKKHSHGIILAAVQWSI